MLLLIETDIWIWQSPRLPHTSNDAVPISLLQVRAFFLPLFLLFPPVTDVCEYVCEIERAFR